MNDLEQLKKKLQDAFKDWEENLYNKSTQKKAERREEFTTASFTKVKPLYTPIDINLIEEINYHWVE